MRLEGIKDGCHIQFDEAPKFTETLDVFILMIPDKSLKDKTFSILISQTNYNILCKELKRNVRTYKGIKIKTI